jgi:hypothetical protein
MSSRRLWSLLFIPVVLTLISQRAREAQDRPNGSGTRATTVPVPAAQQDPEHTQEPVKPALNRPISPPAAPALVGSARLRVPADPL